MYRLLKGEAGVVESGTQWVSYDRCSRSVLRLPLTLGPQVRPVAVSTCF